MERSNPSRVTARDRTAPCDQPAHWRAEVISDFRLRGEERCAAASPVPGFPQVLGSVLSALGDLPRGPWIDVGGGLGGVSSWLERTTGVATVVVDVEPANLRAARRLFPTLRLTAADAAALPLRSGSAAVVVVNGVVSLLDDVERLLGEARRILADDGVVVVTDLWSSGRSCVRRGPSTFWSIEDIGAAAATHGLRQDHVAIADTSTGWWSGAARQVSDEIDERYADRDAYRRWRSEQDRLVTVIESGAVIAAGVVFRADPTGTARPAGA